MIGDDYYAPAILSGNSFCIQQGIKLFWGDDNSDILKDPLISSGDGCIKTFLDNKIRELQSNDCHVVYHKVCSRSDLKLLLLSPYMSRFNPRGYLNHFVFILRFTE